MLIFFGSSFLLLNQLSLWVDPLYINYFSLTVFFVLSTLLILLQPIMAFYFLFFQLYTYTVINSVLGVGPLLLLLCDFLF